MRYVLAFATILLLCSCKDKNEQLDYSNAGKDSKSKSVNVSGLKDTVTAETNLGISPTSIYEGLRYESACDSLVKMRKSLGSFMAAIDSVSRQESGLFSIAANVHNSC